MSIKKLTAAISCILSLIVFTPKNIYATHAQGADFSYQCLGGDTFKVSLSFFRDCEGIDPPTEATISFISINCGQNLTTDLLPEIGETEVSTQFLCPGQVGNSACNGGSLPGTTQTVYSAIVVLPSNCTDWVLSYDLCCRNDQISNLSTPGSQDIYVAATLNNANNNAICNSSPVYGSIPVTYVCAGRPYSYNPGAVDPDGDSLSFTLINPLTDPGTNIPYTSGAFNPNNPLTTSGGFQFNTFTGQMNFTPTGIQYAVITILVREYRNGVLVGTSIRDIQVVTVNCGPGIPPTLSNIDSLAGGASQDSLTVSVCPGESVTFQIRAQDLSPDDLTLVTNVSQTIPGASFTTFDLGNVIRATFNWTPTVLDTGINFFSVTVTDSLSCPIRSSITKTYIINVLDATSAGPDVAYCPAGGPVQLEAIGGSSFTWSPTTGLSNPNIANPLASPTATTTYIVTSNLSALCKNTDTVVISVVPNFPYTLSNDTSICRNGAVQLLVQPAPQFGPYQYSWSPGNTLTNPILPNPIATPLNTTDYRIAVTAANGCRIVDSVRITISGVGPFVNVVADRNNVCPGELVQLNAGIFNLSCGPTIASCSPQNPPVLETYGSGTSTSNTGATPFEGNSEDARTQMLYRASELNTFGITTGTITAIRFNIGTWTSSAAYENFTIKLGCTGQNSLSTQTGFVPVSTVVFGPTSVATQPGNNTFTFATPYDWDGVSNLVVEICYDNANSPAGGNDQVIVSPTTYTSMMRNYADNTTGCSLAPLFTYNELPNTSFRICDPLPRTYTYEWTPTVGLSDPNILNPTVILNNDITYTLSVDDGQCQSVGVINLTTDDSYAIDAVVDGNYECGDDSVQLNVNLTGTPPTNTIPCGVNGTVCSTTQNVFTVGTGNTLNSSTSYPAPFGDFFESTRQQYLYRASELTASGLASGTITRLAFNVSTINGTTTYRNYTVKITCTNLQSLDPNSFVSGVITVFNPKTVNITTGWNTLILDNAYDWDGVSNLVVEICHNNDLGIFSSDFTNNSLSPSTNVGYVASLYAIVDDANACVINTPDGDANSRPNIRFQLCLPPSVASSIVWTPSATLNNPNIANPIAIPTGPTTYTVAYTFANGCIKRDSVTVTPIDFEGTVSNDTAVCLGESAVLTALGGNKYTWQPATGLSSTSQSSVFAQPAATTTYTVIIEDTVTGCTDIDTVTVTINPLPLPAFASDSVLCFTDSITVDAGAGFVTYDWSTLDTTQTITITVSGEYKVTVTDNNGCAGSDSLQLNIGTPPVVDLGADLSGCLGDEFLLDAGDTLAFYDWSTLATTQTISVNTSGSYSVLVFDSAGCPARDTVVVTIIDPSFSLGNDTVICNGTILTLTAGGNGPSYLWSPNGETTPSIIVSTSGQYAVTVTVTGASTCTASDTINVEVNPPVIVDLGTNTVTCTSNPLTLDAGAGFVSYDWSTQANTQTITVTTAGVYSVTVTNQFGCEGIDSITVTDTNPDVNAGANQGICQGDTATLTATSNPSNVSYLWIPSSQTTQSIEVNTAGSYIVRATDANGCFAQDTVVVTVFANAAPNLGPDQTLCENEEAVLTPGNFTVYNWSTNETSDSITINTPDTYSVTVTDANGCTGTDAVVINNFAPIQLLLTDNTICEGDSATITAPSGFVSYQWTNGETTESITVNAVGEYILQVTDANGCLGSDTSFVDFYNYTLEATANPVTINKGDTTQLNVVVTGGSGNYSYTWTPVDGLSAANIANPVATPEDTTVYQVVVLDSTSGCSVGTDTALVQVILENRFIAPDAFTPDGDGKNDGFFVVTTGNAVVTEFKVYNRWGELVHNATSPWDGTYEGEPQPVGTYVFYAAIRLPDQTEPTVINDAFTLIR